MKPRQRAPRKLLIRGFGTRQPNCWAKAVQHSAWRLTLVARSGADRDLPGNGCCYVLALVLPTLRMGGGRRFFEPGGRPGPGLPGFGAPAGQGMVARMLRNPRRTRAGVSRPGGAGFSQGRRRSAAGEAELGVAGDEQPGPPVRGGRVAHLRGGPAEDLLEQAEGVFQVKPAQVRLPAPVHAGGRGAGA
jgi:hypothetical protein